MKKLLFRKSSGAKQLPKYEGSDEVLALSISPKVTQLAKTNKDKGRAGEDQAMPKHPKVQRSEGRAEGSKSESDMQQGGTRRNFGEAMRSLVQQQ